jgi:2'-5' RNA ligase
VAASCIVVPVPEAERAVDLLRRRHTRDGADGMPAHITLIYPFVDDAVLTSAQADEVGEVVGRFPRFAFELTSVERFVHPGGAHVWLAPTPSSPFVELVRALEQAFPAYPSFAGEYDSVIPHLTVASPSTEEAMVEIETELAHALPIRAHATAVCLMVHPDGRWRTRFGFSLGSRATGAADATDVA